MTPRIVGGMRVRLLPVLGCATLLSVGGLSACGGSDSGGAGGSSEASSGSSGSASATTASPSAASGVASQGCPPAGGTAKRVGSFTAAPLMCIEANKTYTATVTTDVGAFTVALDAKKAPKTVNNFVVLARYHFYDGLTFHRVIKDFMAQGGDPAGDGSGGPGYEFADELPKAGAYKVGTVAMANAGPNTNGSQFFVVAGPAGEQLPAQYSAFGQVTDGLKTLKAIEADVAAGRPVDLVASHCGQLPLIVICEILGVPEADRGRVFEMGSAAAASLDLGLSWTDYREMDAGLRHFDQWLEGHLAHLREHPGDDLMSQLAAAQDEGEGLTLEELKATAGLVLVAGFETTVNLLGNAIALLTEHRHQLDLALTDGSRWANVVEEALRIDPPVLLTSRVADRPTQVAGVALRKGSTVLTCLAGANRDPKVFPDPERFDITRENARDHLAFSAGRHHCLGAQLARMEGEVGLRALFDRFPDLRILPGATRRHTQLLRGYATLPAALGQPRTLPA